MRTHTGFDLAWLSRWFGRLSSLGPRLCLSCADPAHRVTRVSVSSRPSCLQGRPIPSLALPGMAPAQRRPATGNEMQKRPAVHHPAPVCICTCVGDLLRRALSACAGHRASLCGGYEERSSDTFRSQCRAAQ